MEIKRLVPDIRFKGFEDEWSVSKFIEICDTFIDGDWIESKDQCSEGIRLIQTGNVGINKFINKPNSTKWISESTFYELKCTEINAGDIIVSRLPEPAGRACLVPNLSIKLITSVDCTIIRPSENYINSYIVQFLSSEGYFKVVKDLLAGGTRQRISKKNLSKINIPVTSYDEQTQIGNYFKQLDDLIDLQQQKHKKLSQLKKAMLEKMFPKEGADMPEIRFKGFDGKWEEKEVRQVCANTYGGGTPRTNIKDYWDGNIPWIQSSDLSQDRLLNVVIRKYITQKGLNNSATKLVPKDSIAIITRVGYGKLAVLPFEYSSSQDFFSLSNLHIDIFFGVFAISRMLNKGLHEVQGTSIKGITKYELLNKKLFIPTDKCEQQKIGLYFQKLDDLLVNSQLQIDKFKNIKQALLAKMFV